MPNRVSPSAQLPRVDVTSFIGRDAELRAVYDAARTGAAVVTVAGPSGIGKTRLLRHARAEFWAAGMQPMWVDLTAAQDADAVSALVGAALAAARAERSDVRQAPALILVDGVEAVSGGHAALVRALCSGVAPGALEAPPDVPSEGRHLRRAVVVCAARTALEVPDERVIVLGPLAAAAGLALLEERVRLQRASAALQAPRDPRIDPTERAAAERLVTGLRGNPLAIALVAGGLCDASLDHACAALLVDAEGPSDSLVAQHAAVWACGRLGPRPAQDLALLGLCRGSFGAAFASRVLARLDSATPALLGGSTAESPAGVAWLDDLVTRALVSVRADADTRGAPSRRYSVPDAVRVALGTDVETPRHADTARRAFAAGAAAFVEDAHIAVAGSSTAGVDDMLDGEVHNVHAALALLHSDEAAVDHQLRARLAVGLSLISPTATGRGEHDAMLASGAASAALAGDTLRRLRLLDARAALATTAGELQRAAQLLKLAAAEAEAAAQPRSTARALAALAVAEADRGNVDDAFGYAKRALHAAPKDGAEAACAQRAYARVCIARGDGGAADDALQLAARLIASGTDDNLRMSIFLDLAGGLRRAGQCDAAAQWVLTASSLPARADSALMCRNQLERSALARVGARHDEARRFLNAALLAADRSGQPRLIAAVQTEAARLALDLGQHGVALRAAALALDAAIHGGAPADEARAALLRARALAAESDLAAAREALQFAERAARRASHVPVQHAVALEQVWLAARSGALDAGTLRRLEDELLVAKRLSRKAYAMALALRGAVASDKTSDCRLEAEGIASCLTDREVSDAVQQLTSAEQSAYFAARALGELRAQHAARELVVAHDARFYELDGKRTSLQRQRSLRLIVLALIEQAEAHPGVGLTQADVLARGWPGEKMRPDSGATRVYTSIRRIRQAGLKSILLTRGDGYLLDPAVTIRRLPPFEAGSAHGMVAAPLINRRSTARGPTLRALLDDAGADDVSGHVGTAG